MLEYKDPGDEWWEEFYKKLREPIPVEKDYKREEELMKKKYGNRYIPDGYGTGKVIPISDEELEEEWDD